MQLTIEIILRKVGSISWEENEILPEIQIPL
jgi:hypothetical protein